MLELVKMIWIKCGNNMEDETFDEIFRTIETLDTKERLLNEIIVWLKAKGLWEECQKDLVTKVIPREKRYEKNNYNVDSCFVCCVLCSCIEV